jgi:hypothetical protein
VAASYRTSESEVTATLQPFAVGDWVPDAPLDLTDAPLYLTADERCVTLPLEATYGAAYPNVPKVWREVLEG